MSILIGVLIAFAVVIAIMVIHFATAKIEAPPEAEADVERDGRAVRLEGIRYMEVRVGIDIEAPTEIVWKHLTDADAFSSWNSTIVSLEGRIGDGERIKLVAKVAPERTFNLTVTVLEPERVMTWHDGNRAFGGVRTFTLTPQEGGCQLTMVEAMSGVFMPMIKPKLPDFRPAFESFVGDLKRVCEARAIS